MNMRIFLLVLCLGGCGGQPLDRHEYLLRPSATLDSAPTSTVVRLSRVQVAAYLDQDGIVLQTSSTEIHGGRQHTWAEPLDEAIGRYLQVALGRQAGITVEVAPLTTGNAETEIEVSIHQLHGSSAGDVRLVAEWLLVGDGVDRIHQFDRSVRQRTDGYAGLVDAHAELLDELAAAMAASLE